MQCYQQGAVCNSIQNKNLPDIDTKCEDGFRLRTLRPLPYISPAQMCIPPQENYT